MKTAALMVCKGFLDRCPADLQGELLSLLPRNDQLEYGELPPIMPLKSENLKWDLLGHLHFTWIAPYLRTLTENEIRLFLAALSKSQTDGLEKGLGIRNHLPELTPLAKRHLRSHLYQMAIQNQQLVPFAFLPDHPLNYLLSLPSSIFDRIVPFLGLHDLAFEMRQIISTAALKKLFSSLPKKEGEYLNTLLLHKEPLTFKRLFLEKWDGTREHLQKIIEERGLYRLALALYGTHPSLIWYVTRRLNMHLGTSLLKYDEKPTHARAEHILSDQIHKIVSFLKPEVSQ
ncbi:MAG: hypothetical protein JSS30_08415 [Verrucomicrobia bacterium]|nr:hypothetical protein [Verrucomicrobiota bacterium]